MGCERQPGSPSAVPVRDLPLCTLPQVHGARQSWFVQKSAGYGQLVAGLDRSIRRLQRGCLVRTRKGEKTTRRGRSRRRGSRGEPRLLFVEVLSPPSLSARRVVSVPETGFETAFGKGSVIQGSRRFDPPRKGAA